MEWGSKPQPEPTPPQNTADSRIEAKSNISMKTSQPFIRSFNNSLIPTKFQPKHLTYHQHLLILVLRKKNLYLIRAYTVSMKKEFNYVP